MLKPEQAKEMLRSLHVPGWARQRAKLADTLRPELRVAALVAMGLDAQGESLAWARSWDEQRRIQWEEIGLLMEIGGEERMQVFSVIFPTFAPFAERAWHLLTRLPYQAGYQRKAFRAPGDPSATRGTRTKWLIDLAQTTGPYQQDLPWFAAW